jgi:hypothetical protein
VSIHLRDDALDDGPHVRYNASKPGRRFVSDGLGGGTLYITETVTRKGFRPVNRTMAIKKSPFAVG